MKPDNNDSNIKDGKDLDLTKMFIYQKELKPKIFIYLLTKVRVID